MRPPGRTALWDGPEDWWFHGARWRVPRGQPWHPPGMPPLALYHLHYLDDLASDAVLDDPGRGALLIDRWLADNASGPAEAWHPYPVSRRIVNLCKWRLAGGAWSAGALASVASHADLLRRCPEYDLRGNHLIANGVALVFAGVLLDGTLATRCRALGLRILERERRRQVLADGGHSERSPMYHAVVLADLLDAVNVLGGVHAPQVAPLVAVVRPMLDWLGTLSLPDGRIAQFNDAAFDSSLPLATLADYAERLGIVAPGAGRPPAVRHLADSGYVRVSRGPWTLIADVGPVGPDEQSGHAHADTLSFELAVGAVRLVVDPGTSTYEPGSVRAAERGTATHNTVCVDRSDSSEVWGAFRTARRAHVDAIQLDETGSAIELRARHDGYSRLRPGVIHIRRWRIRDDVVEVTDLLEGAGEHELECGLLLNPQAAVEQAGPDEFLVSLAGHRVRLRFAPALAARIVAAWWAPQFGRRVATRRIEGRARRVLPVTLGCSIEYLGACEK